MVMKKKVFGLLLAFFLSLGFLNNLWAIEGVTVDDTGADETVITLKVELCPDPVDDPATEEKEGLTKEEVQTFIDERIKRVTEIWNSCGSKLRIKPGAPEKRIRFVFDVVVLDDCKAPKDPMKKRVKVHPGDPPKEKNADAANFWETNNARTIAHEFGHLMGLGEEYSANPKGPTRENLMGRPPFTKVLKYHLATILFTYQGDPDKKELERRRLMKMLLRKADQDEARKIAEQNDITKEQYDAYADMFKVNDTEIQPDRPGE